MPRLAAHPDYLVTAVVDPSAATREAAVASLPSATPLCEVDDLADAAADLAVVAVPNHLHTSVATRLLRRGFSVFLEKPVCLSTREAGELAEAERAGGAMLLAGSAARYRRDVVALCAASGSLGAIRHVDLSWIRARGVPDGVGWFTRRALSGGGASVDLGWHLLDMIEPLLGPVGIVQVAGAVSRDFVNDDASRAGWRRDAASGATGDVEDTVRALLVTDTGVSVGLRAAWASHEPRDVTEIHVHGSAGSAVLRCTFGFSPNRLPAPVLTVRRHGVTETVAVEPEPVGAEYEHQLARLPELLADPANRGRAISEAHRSVDVIERLYASVPGLGPSSAPGTPGTPDRLPGARTVVRR
uniref:Oxidoreductase n=1 Tax=Micromonospora sp. HK160111 TaxID=1245497 RepID=A0A2H4RBZ2_9ACTN|nr:oxidoreductase [Micromonospora sp. HK160111]